MLIKKEKDNYLILNMLDKYLLGHNGCIAGGCFKNIFNKEKVKDIDIFFKSKTDFDNAIQYYDKLCKDKNSDFSVDYENKKVKAYYDKKSGITIELVQTKFGKPDELLKMFDFTITKFAYYKEAVVNPDTGKSHDVYKILHHHDFFEHLFFKRLVIDDNMTLPVNTFERMIRYIKYGYLPCKDTKLKLIEAIQKQVGTEGLQENSLYEGLD